MMPMTISIRKAQQYDAKEISAVIINAIKETNAKDYPVSFIEKLPEQFSPEQIANRISSRETYVALHGEAIIGAASLDGVTIRSVFVMPTHQNSGIGLALMEHIEKLAFQRKIAKLTVPSSITAEGFYKKIGYVKLHETYEGVEKIIIMSKVIYPSNNAMHATSA